MSFGNVKLVEGVFSTEEKHAIAKALPDVMVRFSGSGKPTTRDEWAVAAPVRNF